MSGHSIHQLPLHLIRVVLSQLDSIRTLGAAILSNSSFYAAYKEAPDGLIFDILSRQTSRETLRYGIALQEAESIDNADLSGPRNFLTRWFGRNNFSNAISLYRLQPGGITPSVAAEISKTHILVDYFTRDAIHEMSSHSQQWLGTSCSTNKQTAADETFRVQRALYIFQIYCALFFRKLEDLAPDEQRERQLNLILHQTFFDNFSPWVNEQLACIHGYLERFLSRSFDDVAAHDIRWGRKGVDWVSKGARAEHKQAYLFLGLEFLFELDQAHTYDERLALLQSVGEESLLRTKHMLASHFRHAGVPTDDLYIGPMETWPAYFLKSLSRGDTDGPDRFMSNAYRMWFEAHKTYPITRVVYHKDHAVLRRCGYVLWGASDALADDKILHERFDRARKQAASESEQREQARKAMRKSWLSRIVLYKLGARGYWKDGDLSQIAWKDASNVARNSGGKTARRRARSR